MLASIFSQIPLEALAVRMVATAVVVIAVSWAVGVFGPLVGGALAGLPVILGPGFYFLAAQASEAFVAQAASYALLSLCATQFFLLAYIVVAGRASPWIALGFAMATWLLAAFSFQLFPARPLIGVILFIAATGVCFRLGAKFATHQAPLKRKAGIALFAMRGMFAGVLVALITTAAGWLGAVGAGLLLAFPIGYALVALTVHQKYGAASVTALLHSAILGTVSLAGFCSALALTASYLPSSVALGIAMTTSVLVTFGLVSGVQFRRP